MLLDSERDLIKREAAKNPNLFGFRKWEDEGRTLNSERFAQEFSYSDQLLQLLDQLGITYRMMSRQLFFDQLKAVARVVLFEVFETQLPEGFSRQTVEFRAVKIRRKK